MTASPSSPARGAIGWVTLALLANTVSSSLLQAFVIPVLPLLRELYDTDQATITLILTGQLLVGAVAAPVIGRLGDLYGKAPLMVVCASVTVATSVVSAIWPTLTVLIVTRFVQGIATGSFALAYGIVRDVYPPARRANIIGTLTGTIAIGQAGGLIAAGPVVEVFGVSGLFAVPAVISSIALALLAASMRLGFVRRAGTIDWAGAILLSVWLVALIAGLTVDPWPLRVVLFVVAALFLVLWYRFERGHPNPLNDVRVLSSPILLRANAVTLVFGFVLQGQLLIYPMFAQADPPDGLGADVSQSGAWLLPQMAMLFIAGLASGPVQNRLGARATLVISAVLVGIGIGVIPFALGHSWLLYAGSALIGIGYGIGFPVFTTIVVTNVPKDQTSAATGLNGNLRTIGGTVGAQSVALLLVAAHGTGTGYTFPAVALVIGCVAVVAVSFSFPRRVETEEVEA